MSDQLEISAEPRTISGKQVKKLRHEGLVPAVVYGHNVESMPVQVKRDDLTQVLKHGGRTSIMQMKIGRKRPFSVAVKQLQTHPISGQLLHADFYRIAQGEKLRMKIPLHFEGEPPVVKTHEVAIVRSANEIQVECLPDSLPSAIPVPLSRLENIGDTIRVADLDPIDHVTFLDNPDEVIVTVAAARREAEVAEKAEEAEEAATEAGAEEGAETAEESGEGGAKAA